MGTFHLPTISWQTEREKQCETSGCLSRCSALPLAQVGIQTLREDFDEGDASKKLNFWAACILTVQLNDSISACLFVDKLMLKAVLFSARPQSEPQPVASNEFQSFKQRFSQTWHKH